MDTNVDHYEVLGLPFGVEGAKLSEKDISKAYRSKALELHPDKRRDDPNAHAKFQSLKTSYEILKDSKARKLFDDLLRVKHEQQRRHAQQDSKRRKMVSDLEARERAAFAPDISFKAREEEERIARKLKEEIARIRTMHANRGMFTTSSKKETAPSESMGSAGPSLDKDRVLKISWEKVGEYYTAERLKELFTKFGEVEDLIIKSSKKKGSALVVMATKDGAVAAAGNVCGDISNPLLVLPLQPALRTEFPFTQRSVEPDGLNNLVGAGHKAFEDSVLEKLQKAQARKKE